MSVDDLALVTPSGAKEVKFLVDPASAGQVVVDETGDTVAIATILTMVRKLDQG